MIDKVFAASAAAFAALTLTAGGAFAQTSGGSGSGGAAPMTQKASEPDTPNAMDKQFVMMAGQGNVAEIQTSRLALKKSKDEGVRKVASMLILQHGQAHASLKEHAAKAGLKVPDTTDPMHKAMYKRLSRLEGAAFDKAYMMGQVKDHYKTVNLFEKEMAKGRNSHVQSFAQRYLPDIETHTKHIVGTASRLGVPTASRVANNPAAKSMMSSGASTTSMSGDR